MALRLLKIHAPVDAAGDLREVLEGLTPVDAWQDVLPDRFELQLLLHGSDVEESMNAFEQRLGGKGIRMVLSPVEATSPRAPESKADALAEQNSWKMPVCTPPWTYRFLPWPPSLPS